MKLVYTIFLKNCKLFFNGNLKKTAEAPVFLLPCHYESLDAVLSGPILLKTWLLWNSGQSSLYYLICQKPRYQPVLIRPGGKNKKRIHHGDRIGDTEKKRLLEIIRRGG